MKDYARSEPRLKVVSSSQLLNSETKAWAKILKLFIKGSRPRLSKKLAQSLENLYQHIEDHTDEKVSLNDKT